MNWKKLSTKEIIKVYKRVFLNHCQICKAPSSQALCQYCENGFIKNQTHCSHCRLPMIANNTICGRCQRRQPSYSTCIAPLIYQDLTANLIRHIKFHQETQYIRVLNCLLIKAIDQEYLNLPFPSHLIPIPSHPERIRERGFSHTQLMARLLSRQLPHVTPVLPILQKHQHTEAQHQLPLKDRQKAQQNAFFCSHPVPNHVALLDDVMTTGHTIDTCVTLLLNHGAKNVDVWVYARTPASSSRPL